MMDEPDQHPRRDSTAWGTWIACILAISPLLYVLSIGPVVGLTQKGLLPYWPVRAFYMPVTWLHANTPLDKPLEWYVDLWSGH